MHILLTTCGIAGDHHPFVAWGRFLLRQGHEVTLIGGETYRGLAEQAQLPFVSVISREEDVRRSALRQQSWSRSLESGLQNMLNDTRPIYEALADLVRPGESVIAANIIALGARLAQEKFQVPMATIGLSPSVLRSQFDPLCWPEWMPRWTHGPAHRFLMKKADKRFTPTLNAFRRELQLSPLTQSVRDWMFSPQKVINFFPEWLLQPQADWPPHVSPIGFPNPDAADAPPLPAPLDEFLNAGPPPVVISHTSGFRSADAFYREAIRAVELLKERAVVLAPEAVRLPTLPAGMLRVAFASHLRLYPRARLAIHHGGMGTVAAGLLSGLPQFIVPAMYDQPENARRLRALGVGDYLSPARFRASAAVPRLRHLLDSPMVRQSCARYAQLMQGVDSFQQATTLLRTLDTQRRSPTRVSPPLA